MGYLIELLPQSLGFCDVALPYDSPRRTINVLELISVNHVDAVAPHPSSLPPSFNAVDGGTATEEYIGEGRAAPGYLDGKSWGGGFDSTLLCEIGSRRSPIGISPVGGGRREENPSRHRFEIDLPGSEDLEAELGRSSSSVLD
ncbi:hypothetical protein C8F04DRAFT_1198155 [Mycena alexandri]|uniref:Uncharacterized protein n=1 Tax=Mycena alexandri TaxID=1745969 RepID=A0AAD6S0L9_9AGAR|nr:hypothetical protein C8F04DRAFT_1198155 [Mycena alexandri]